MKSVKKVISLLLALCLALGCLTASALAADAVVSSARGSAKDPILCPVIWRITAMAK